jgi:hypothetical protein
MGKSKVNISEQPQKYIGDKMVEILHQAPRNEDEVICGKTEKWLRTLGMGNGEIQHIRQSLGNIEQSKRASQMGVFLTSFMRNTSRDSPIG